MLKKLIHYDLKWCFKVVVIYYSLGLVFAVLGRLLELTPDSTFFNTIEGICKGASLSLVITGIVNCIIRVWVRTVLNMYKDESYLTHTLPVDIKTHFLAKFLTALITVLASIIVLLISVIIMYLSKDNINYLKETLNIIGNSLGGSIVLFISLIFITILLEVIFIVMAGFFGIVMGHSYNTKKGLKSVLFGIGSFFLANTLTIIGLVVASFISPNLHKLIFENNTSVEFSFLCVIFVVAILIYVVYSTILYFLINCKLKKGINID